MNEIIERARKAAHENRAYLVIKNDAIIDNDHLNVVWYGGGIATLMYQNYALEIVASGEVCIVGEIGDSDFRYQNKMGDGAYAMNACDSLRTTFKSDKEFEKALDEGKISYQDNSWFEYFVYNDDDEVVADEVEDSESLADVLSEGNIKTLVDWLEEIAEEQERLKEELYA